METHSKGHTDKGHTSVWVTDYRRDQLDICYPKKKKKKKNDKIIWDSYAKQNAKRMPIGMKPFEQFNLCNKSSVSSGTPLHFSLVHWKRTKNKYRSRWFFFSLPLMIKWSPRTTQRYRQHVQTPHVFRCPHAPLTHTYTRCAKTDDRTDRIQKHLCQKENKKQTQHTQKREDSKVKENSIGLAAEYLI